MCVGPCTIEIYQLPLWPVPYAILNLFVFLFQSGITHFIKEASMINNGLPTLVTKRYYYYNYYYYYYYSKQVLHKNQILSCSCERAAKVINSINTRSFYNMYIP